MQTLLAESPVGADVEASSFPLKKVSDRRAIANRRNAQRSTGPRTPEGKQASSRNAITHGIFCRDLLVPGESIEEMRALRQAFIQSLKPADAAELSLVDQIFSSAWKLRRVQSAEQKLHVTTLQDWRDHHHNRDLAWTGDGDVYEYPEGARETDAASPGLTLALCHADDKSFKPLGRLQQYEHRLLGMMLRLSRELRQVQATRGERENDSPFATDEEVMALLMRVQVGEKIEGRVGTFDMSTHAAKTGNPAKMQAGVEVSGANGQTRGDGAGRPFARGATTPGETPVAKTNAPAVAPVSSKAFVPVHPKSLDKPQARRQRMLQAAVTAGLAGKSPALGSFSIPPAPAASSDRKPLPIERETALSAVG
jgi:hypothetical protein